MASSIRLPWLLLSLTLLTSCAHDSYFTPPIAEAPRISRDTESARLLKSLPPSKENTVVSVYDFQDLTGQLKANDSFASYSRAVTQGGLSLLNKSLLQAGNGHWFTVLERGGLKNLLQERQIIQLTRAQYTQPDGSKLPNLSPLLYAGMLIEGGVVGYDSNIVTGGAGANYLGVGADVKYRRDIVTVDLRAVSIADGQILLSVTSEKTVYSSAFDGNVFKYVSFNHLLQAETGFTINEPPLLAVRQAIETDVYSLIMEGTRQGLWQFADPQAGKATLEHYAQWLGDNENPVEHAAAPAAKIPDAIHAIPPNATPAQKTPPVARNEKKGIIGNISDFLSFGDEHDPDRTTENAPAVPLNPSNYPVTPTPPRAPH